MRLVVETYLAVYALTVVAIWIAMVRRRRIRIDAKGKRPSLFGITCVSIGVSLCWPLFALVALVKLFTRRREWKLDTSGWSEEMRRGFAQRAALRVREMHATQKPNGVANGPQKGA